MRKTPIIIGVVAIVLISIFATVEQYRPATANVASYSPTLAVQHTDSFTLILADFANTANISEYNHQTQIAKMNAFMNSSSNGLQQFEVQSIQHIKLQHNHSYYGTNSEVSYDANITALFDELSEHMVLSGLYVLIHPGYSESLRDGTATDLIDEFIDFEEFQIVIFSAHSPWSILCHELGHYLGLPDLYYSNMMGFYAMMGQGVYFSGDDSWNGSSPADFCAWSKLQLNWQGYYNVKKLGSYIEFAVAENSSYTIIKFEHFLIQYMIHVPRPGVIISKSFAFHAQYIMSIQTTANLETTIGTVAISYANGIISLHLAHSIDVNYWGSKFASGTIILIFAFVVFDISRKLKR